MKACRIFLSGFGAEKEIGGEALAGGAQAGDLEDGGVGPLLKGQGEQIGAKEVLPVAVVCARVGQVDVGPEDETFAFWVGGALEQLEEFEAKDRRGLDLRVEGVDEADVGIDGGVAVGVGRGDQRSDRDNINAGGAETRAGCGSKGQYGA